MGHIDKLIMLLEYRWRTNVGIMFCNYVFYKIEYNDFFKLVNLYVSQNVHVDVSSQGVSCMIYGHQKAFNSSQEPLKSIGQMYSQNIFYNRIKLLPPNHHYGWMFIQPTDKGIITKALFFYWFILTKISLEVYTDNFQYVVC